MRKGTKAKRGTCAVCGWEYTVNDSGDLRRHSREHIQGGAPCPGSGMKPLEAQPKEAK